MGNGVFWFIAGATILYIVAKGYGKNVSSAFNTLINGNTTNLNAAQPGGITSNLPNVQAPGTSVTVPAGQLSYLGAGVSIA